MTQGGTAFNLPVIKDERGTAILIALLLLTLVGAVAAALVAISTMETIISARYRHAQEAAFGAEAAFELALRDLSIVPDWSRVLAVPPGNLVSTFDDGEVLPRGPDGRALDLGGMTAQRQRESDTRLGPGFGADSPRWRLFVHATPAAIRAPPDLNIPLYFVVWVSDDEADGDGDPARDGNGRILVHALAVGSGGARRAVEGRISRTPAGDVRLEGWGQGR